MRGAREYTQLFPTGQYGRFYLTSGSHARGSTFHIQILPEGETAIPNGPNNLCLNKEAVEVYGITGGQPGWTETYGWLHNGKWVEDFEQLVQQRKTQIEDQWLKHLASAMAKEEAEKQRVKVLLDSY